MLAKRSLLVVALTAAALVSPAAALAGKPGGGGSTSSSISLIVPAGSEAGYPHYGDSVTFNVSTTATASPYVNLQCFQNGALVASGWAGYFDGALGSRSFGLYSPQWTGGAADCTAYLDMSGRKGWQQLASTSFHVNA
jgi:hypothetical protein